MGNFWLHTEQCGDYLRRLYSIYIFHFSRILPGAVGALVPSPCFLRRVKGFLQDGPACTSGWSKGISGLWKVRSTSQAGHLWLEHIPGCPACGRFYLANATWWLSVEEGILRPVGQRGFLAGALTVVESPLLALPSCSSVSWWVMEGSGWWRRRVFPRLGHLLSERLQRISFAGTPGLGWQGKNEPIPATFCC